MCIYTYIYIHIERERSIDTDIDLQLSCAPHSNRSSKCVTPSTAGEAPCSRWTNLKTNYVLFSGRLNYHCRLNYHLVCSLFRQVNQVRDTIYCAPPVSKRYSELAPLSAEAEAKTIMVRRPRINMSYFYIYIY